MKYWVYMNGEIPGSYRAEELTSLPGFQETAMVCPAEGGIENRNWAMAGQFPDIVEAMSRSRGSMPPPKPIDLRPEPGPATGPDEVLNDASTKIFGHVTELMKELENRREEKALTQSLQRQMIELKNEIQALRERNAYLTERADLLPEFQKKENKLEKKIHELEADNQNRETRISELNMKLKEMKVELDRTKNGEAGLSEDLIRQTKLTEELASQLAEKELRLARAFGLIAKLESMLGDIVPGATAGMSRKLAPGDDVDIHDAPDGSAPDDAAAEAQAPAAQEKSAQGAPSESETQSQQRAIAAAPPEPVISEELKSLVADITPSADSDPSEHTPSWPAEGEVQPVDPPWKKKLKKATEFLKNKLAKKDPPSDQDEPA